MDYNDAVSDGWLCTPQPVVMANFWILKVYIDYMEELIRIEVQYQRECKYLWNSLLL